MRKANKRITPNFINTLSECEIFVFGSNLQGHHCGGAAKMACEKFGAKWGVGVGHTGQCYAIPTMHGGLEEIRPYVNRFIDYAKNHPNNRFLLTRIGCGIAGFNDEDMAQLFVEVQDIPNITIPKEWLPTILADRTSGHRKPRGRETAPSVIDEKVLMDLCRKHAYEIGAGINEYLPEIEVRYVIDNNKFGYAKFGDFFFDNIGNFYVWHTHEGWMSQHNQDAVHGTFDDECYCRGHAVEHIFAGVKTNFRDSNNEWIYTGDVLNIYLGPEGTNPQHTFALTNIHVHHDLPGPYSFPLDNHEWPLTEAAEQGKITRAGTVFFQLKAELFPLMTIWGRALMFNDWHDTNEDRMRKALMARYTPNFAQEYEQYAELEAHGCEEFNWRK